jgi:hypothetical protein
MQELQNSKSSLISESINMASNTAAPPTFTFHHAELGPMTGIVTPENVVQFRAVPFAMIPVRFKRSIQLGNLQQTNRDFTKHG